MKNKTKWGIGFLGVTALAIIMEFLAALDNNPDTIPWTQYIVTYIPEYLFFGILLGGIYWVTNHFIKKYMEKKK
jgi:hypothetical protein